jgi:Fe-S cluster assembly iron-binding protein IscA
MGDQFFYGNVCTDYFTNNRFDEIKKLKHTIKAPTGVTCEDEAVAGDTVEVSVKLAKTKKLDDITITYDDKTESILETMKFVMPNADVEIKIATSTVSTKTKTAE